MDWVVFLYRLDCTSLSRMAKSSCRKLPSTMNATLYRIVLRSSNVSWPEVNRNLKFCNPTKGLAQMPLLYWKLVNAMYAPGMGIYEKMKKKTTAGRHMSSSVLFCDTSRKKLGFL